MTTSERKRMAFQGCAIYVTSLMYVFSILLFLGVGIVSQESARAETTWTETLSTGAKAGVAIVDVAAQKDVLWLALAATCISSLATIIAMGLTFWIAITGVKAIDRIGHMHGVDPWHKGK